MRMTRNRARTHVIEHLVDGLADHMRFATASCADVPSAAASHMAKAKSRGMT
jgi:hypothetical protein